MHQENEEGEGSCEGHHHYHCQGSEEDMEMMMWRLFMEAKSEVIKEKMKKKLELMEGKKLDEMAGILVETMLEAKKTKMDMMRRKSDVKEKIERIFHKE